MSEVAQCKVCESDKLSPALTIDNEKGFRYVECTGCGLAFIPREPSSEEVEVLNQYWTTEAVERIKQDPVLRARNIDLLRSLAQLAPNRTLLEIGCGAGNILRRAAEEGWAAIGTEIAPDAVSACRAQGLNVLQGDLHELKLESQAFGAVIMSEVIEHLITPKHYLQEIRRVMAPGGVLYLTTPNFGSLARLLIGRHWRVFGPQHLQLFRPRTLRFMLRDCGFAILHLRTRNIDPAEIINYFRGRKKIPEETFRRQLILRDSIEKSASLKTVKRFANFSLGVLALGSTIVCTAKTSP